MTQEQAKKLPHGLYKIYWKEGGYTFGAMGSCYDGRRWIAPCNWTSGDLAWPKVATTLSWAKIERLEEIVSVQNYGQPDNEGI